MFQFQSGIDISIFKTHSTTSAVVSKAFNKGFPISNILSCVIAGSFRFSLVFKLCARHCLSQVVAGSQSHLYDNEVTGDSQSGIVYIRTFLQCRGSDQGPRQDHSILQHHGNVVLMAACRGRDTGPRPNHSILLSHGCVGLMAACRGRDTGPQPNHSIFPSHGSGGLMAACRADIPEVLLNLTTCVVREKCHF